MRKNTQLVIFFPKTAPKTLKYFEGRKQTKPFRHLPLKIGVETNSCQVWQTEIQWSSRERTKPLCLQHPRVEVITLLASAPDLTAMGQEAQRGCVQPACSPRPLGTGGQCLGVSEKPLQTPARSCNTPPVGNTTVSVSV